MLSTIPFSQNQRHSRRDVTVHTLSLPLSPSFPASLSPSRLASVLSPPLIPAASACHFSAFRPFASSPPLASLPIRSAPETRRYVSKQAGDKQHVKETASRSEHSLQTHLVSGDGRRGERVAPSVPLAVGECAHLQGLEPTNCHAIEVLART